MKISSNNGINFGRALSTKERQDAEKVQKEALKLLDCDKVIAIIPEHSLPSDVNKNIGVGQLNSVYNDKFLEFFKTYTGMNAIKVLPQGRYKFPNKGFFCNYSSSGLTLGEHTISLEELASEKYGKILSQETLNNVYKNAKYNGADNLANFENVVGEKSPHGLALQEAFNNFKKSTNLGSIKKEFDLYKTKNADYIEKLALFEVLSDTYKTNNVKNWSDIDKNLFNTDIISEEIRNKRVAELKSKNSEKIDFVFFKQYLADKNLEHARKNLNNKGVNLVGDCLIGFSADEYWAYPKAFEEANICSKDWGLKSLNYSNILEESSESNKLLRKKVEQFAKRYDNIRFDVGWAYVDPILYTHNPDFGNFKERYLYDNKVDGYRTKEPLSDKLISIIEDAVRKVKGTEYKQENLFYEIEAGPKEFSAFDWKKNTVIDGFKNRTIVQSTMFMDENYGTPNFLENKMGVARKNYIIMTGNHDHLALASLAAKSDPEGILKASGDNINDVVQKQCKALAKDLKLKENSIKNSKEEFVKAKFAFNFLGSNIKMFFMDIFGRNEQFDSQIGNSVKNYRYRISPNYEEEFHRAVQEKRGLNIMDALSKAMKAKGLDKTNKKTYEQLQKYSKILYEKGALTEEEANKLKPLQKLSKTNKILIALGVLASIGGIFVYASKFRKENND